MLSRTPISLRIHLMTLLAMLGLLAQALVAGQEGVSELEHERITVIRHVVESAASIAEHFEGEAKAGRLGVAAAQTEALSAIRAIRYRGQEYVWINDLAPKMVMHPFRPDLEGKDLTGMKDPNGFALFVAFSDTVRKSGSGVVGYLWPRPGSAEPVEKLSYVQGFAPWNWVIGSGLYVDDLRVEQRTMILRDSLLALGVIILVGLLAWLTARGIVGPLSSLTRATEHVAAGHLDATMPGSARGDELGVLARALDTLRQSARRERALEQENKAARAKAELRQAAMDRHTDDLVASVNVVENLVWLRWPWIMRRRW